MAADCRSTWPNCGASPYEVSDRGRVRSLSRYIRNPPQLCGGRVLKPTPNKTGHLQIALSGPGGGRRTHRVHRLVLEAFVGPCPPGLMGCHGNGNPADNRLENLRWDTAKGNAADSIRHGTCYFINTKGRRTACPLGHKLVEYNLVPWHAKRRRRGCLACSRARAYERVARLRGQEYDFEAGAHSYYAQILASLA
jgi:hypothetical protein